MKHLITWIALLCLSFNIQAKEEIDDIDLNNVYAQNYYSLENFYGFDQLQNLFSYDEKIEGVHHRKNAITINPDGSITQKLPYLIEKMEFNNIKLKGSDKNASFGNIGIYNLRMDITSTIRSK